MQIIFEDKDLEELITTGISSKYKKYTRNAKFMKALATAYNYLRLSERASDLRSVSFLHYEQLKFRRYSLWQQEMKIQHLSRQFIRA